MGMVPFRYYIGNFDANCRYNNRDGEEVSKVDEEMTDNVVLAKAKVLSLLARRRPGMSSAYYELELRHMLESGEAARVGRGEYLVGPDAVRPTYSYGRSETEEKVVDTLLASFDGADFSVFELAQLNEFLNHQIGRGTVFVSIERDLENFAFDALAEALPGGVLFRPSVEDYHRYATDGAVVVLRLVTEAPRGGDWGAPPEKFLVDLVAESLLRSLVPEGEVLNVFEGVLRRYVVNVSRLLRYAARRGCREEVSTLVEDALANGKAR